MYIQPSCTVFRKEPLNKTTYERPENVSFLDSLSFRPSSSSSLSRPFRRSYITTGLKREPNGTAFTIGIPSRPWTSLTRALSFVGYIKTLLLLRTHHTSPSIDEFEKKREKERERERDFTSIGIILESIRRIKFRRNELLID